MKSKLNGRVVEITQIWFAGEVEDCHAEAAYWLDTEVDLTEEELSAVDAVTDYGEEWLEDSYRRAEDYAEAWDDRLWDSLGQKYSGESPF